jgi:hypothetical protein
MVLYVISICISDLLTANAYAITFVPRSEHLLLAKWIDSNEQFSLFKYLAIASHPLGAISLAFKSSTLSVLFSNKCSMMT